jgi:hypothetical protein
MESETGAEDMVSVLEKKEIFKLCGRNDLETIYGHLLNHQIKMPVQFFCDVHE